MKQGDLVVKKATEYGAVEIWMNERVRRACASSCADFVYGFLEVLFNFLFFTICFGDHSLWMDGLCFGDTSIFLTWYFLIHTFRVLPKEKVVMNIGLYGVLKGRKPLQSLSRVKSSRIMWVMYSLFGWSSFSCLFSVRHDVHRLIWNNTPWVLSLFHATK